MGLRSGLSVPAWQPGAYRSRRHEADAGGAAVAGGAVPETASAKPLAMYMPCSQVPKRWPCSRDSISPHIRAAQAQGKAIWAICSRPMPTTLETELPSQN